MARIISNETIGIHDPNLPSNLTQDLGASTYQAPNFTQQNLGNQAFPHDPSVYDEWGNIERGLENPAKDYYERPSGLATLKNWASNKLGTGFNLGKAAISGIGNAIMPGLGWALGAINPGKLRGYNYGEGRYNTQEEYEENQEAQRTRNRIDYMMDRRAAGKGFSQKNLNEQTMGSKPGWYGNVWGGDGRGTTGGQQIAGAPANLGQSLHGTGEIGGDGNKGNGNKGSSKGGHGSSTGMHRAQGGRIGFRNGEFIDENINVEGPNFDFNENIEMAEGKSPFELRIDELVDTGMSWQEAWEIASEEFGQIAEGESDQGIASIV